MGENSVYAGDGDVCPLYGDLFSEYEYYEHFDYVEYFDYYLEVGDIFVSVSLCLYV